MRNSLLYVLNVSRWGDGNPVCEIYGEGESSEISESAEIDGKMEFVVSEMRGSGE